MSTLPANRAQACKGCGGYYPGDCWDNETCVVCGKDGYICDGCNEIILQMEYEQRSLR